MSAFSFLIFDTGTGSGTEGTAISCGTFFFFKTVLANLLFSCKIEETKQEGPVKALILMKRKLLEVTKAVAMRTSTAGGAKYKDP